MHVVILTRAHSQRGMVAHHVVAGPIELAPPTERAAVREQLGADREQLGARRERLGAELELTMHAAAGARAV